MANRTYEYNPINDSPVIVATAGEVLKTAAAVLLTKDGVKLPEAGKKATGIVLLGDETVAKGDDITVQIRNQGMWAAGAKIEAGDFLAVDAEGLCQKATTRQYILAMALTPATAKGDIVNVAIIHAGYEA